MDLKYAKELHDKTKYFPFCPEKIQVPDEWLSPWQKDKKPKKYSTTPKLIQTQYDKINYVIEGRMLDWYLEHGMEIIKIHKKLIYKKSTWLKSYIEYNISQRNKYTKNTFENYFYKLLNNAFYGKTLENVYNRQNIKIVNTKEKAMHHAAKLGFTRSTHFGKDVEAIHYKRTTIKFDKFNYIGFTVLELSKLTMYRFVYDVLYKAYGDNFKIHGGDTDSVFIELINNSDITKISEHIHSSKLGYFSDELPCFKKMICLTYLKSKMYSYQTINIKTGEIEDSKKLKGLTKASTKNIKFEHFKNCVYGEEQPNVSSYRLGSKHHVLSLINQEKKSINNYDDKRYILHDGITTLPFGHYSLTANA